MQAKKTAGITFFFKKSKKQKKTDKNETQKSQQP